MHLALAIGGCTLAELEERMAESEFRLWDLFDRQEILPSRRATLQAASIARWIGIAMGGVRPSATVMDFVLVPATPTDGDELNADAGSAMISAATSSRVFRLGQGRKTKG